MPSSKLPIIAWDQAYNRNGDGKLPRAAVNAIRTYMDNHTLTGFVKAETLAEATGMTVRGVRKQIASNVAAGWLEIAEPGNSSRATVYRLTYPPDREQQFTVCTEETMNHSSPLDSGRVNHSSAKGEPQFTPTTPRTSPQEKFSTTPGTVNSGSPFGEPDLTAQKNQDETGLESRSLAVAGGEHDAPTSCKRCDPFAEHDAPTSCNRCNPAIASWRAAADPFG